MTVSKQYLDGLLNTDQEANSLAPNEIVNAQNMRFGNNDESEGRWESIGSNTEIENPFLPEGTNITIGSTSNEQDHYLVLFNYNSNNTHGIYLYYKLTDTFYKVLESNVLNFSEDKLIQTAINPDKHILYWTDNLNEPRRINLMAAIKMNHSGTSPVPCEWQYSTIEDAFDFTLIRRPPCLTGSIEKVNDPAFTANLIANESFQFAYQYVYYDGEQSVLSAFTTASRLNALDASENKITVKLNISEKIPESVRFVRLAVIYSGKGFIIKTWDTTKGAAIQNHNNGTPLTFDFYNDLIGEPLDGATLTTPFHSVPLLSSTLEIAKNRLFLGDNVEGYDSPASTSLEVIPSAINIQNPTPSPRVILVRHRRDGHSGDSVVNGYSYAGYYVKMTEASPQGYYLIIGYEQQQIRPSDAPAYPTITDVPPTSVAITGLEYKGKTINDVINATIPDEAGRANIRIDYNETVTNYTTSVTGISTATINIFKSKSRYRFGVVFYDRAMRKCGVVTRDGLSVTIPQRDYTYSVGISAINWILNNVDALSEIPSWAHYYSVVATKNLRTRFFLQFSDNGLYYAGKDSGTSEWKKADGVFASTTAIKSTAIAVSLKSLLQAGLGYAYNEGDLCILTDENGTTHEIPILEVQGDTMILSAKDIGATNSKKFIIEIYTPYKPSEQEPFYEMGEIYSIANPGTNSRMYGQTSGLIAPDCFVISRNFEALTYMAEAMSPNDKIWNRWDSDHGRINIISEMGQKHKKTNVSFSNAYVPGTQTNGLSAFEALNEENLPLEIGQINKLVNTSKSTTEGEGTVMLAIGSAGCRTASLYLGETQITDSTGSTAYFVKSMGVIGQINILRGDYGTNHPESVVTLNGNVYWLDVVKGKFIQYSLNGLFPISDYKMKRFTAQLCKKLLSTNQATIEAFGSRPFVFGGVDPYHGELLWTIPKLSNSVPKGQLEDYDSNNIPDYAGSIDFPYDMLDYKGKTIVYKISADRWMGAFTFEAENFTNLSNDLYSFKGGKLYEHNRTDSFNTFYGEPHRSRIALVCNKDNTVKIFQTIALECSQAPQWVHFRTEEPYVQSSDLVNDDFAQKEGVFYASILRDRLTPGDGTPEEKLYKGDDMRSKAMYVLLQFDNQQKRTWFRLASIGYLNSSGHY